MIRATMDDVAGEYAEDFITAQFPAAIAPTKGSSDNRRG
jgi:hypothetical protein